MAASSHSANHAKGRNPNGPKKYWAFISYSSKDAKWGRWLHHQLENYPIPAEFRGTTLFDGSVLGRDLKPCFRDRDELAGSAELAPAIDKALRETRYLIVLCSPNSAQSEWVNKEIVDFKALGGEKRILALILNGEPNSGGPTECFPPALRLPAEPLAGDLRREGDGKERGFLKILAGIAQLDFDVLYRRHERAQRRKRLVLAACGLVLIAILTGLTIFAFTQKREARKQESFAIVQKNEAQKNARIAQRERDKARETLARLYVDRAMKAETRNHSLAWALRAAETSPDTLDHPQLSTKLDRWYGPWPGPDLCLGTGIPKRGFTSDFPSLVSEGENRLLVQTTARAWRLIDHRARTALLEVIADDEIEKILSPAEASWFVIKTPEKIEIRRWSDGGMIKSHQTKERIFEIAVDSTSIVFMTRTPGFHQPKTNTLSRLIREQDDFVPETIKTLTGEIRNLACHCHDGRHHVFYLVMDQEEESSKLRGIRHSGNGPWQNLDLSQVNAIDFHGFIKARFPTNRPLVFFYQKDSRPPFLFDLEFLEVHHLEKNTNDSAMVAGALQDGSGLQIVYGERQNNGNTFLCRAKGADGKAHLLFDGTPVSRPTVLPSRTEVVAWDEASKSLLLQRPGHPLRRIPVCPPVLSDHSWPDPQVYEILEAGHDAVIIEVLNTRYTGLILVDLSQADHPRLFEIGLFQFEQILDFKIKQDTLSLVALTHQSRAISYFDGIKPTLPQAPGKATSLDEDRGRVSWLGVESDGSYAALRQRSKDGQRQISLSRNRSETAEWFDSGWSGGINRVSPDGLSRSSSGMTLLTGFFGAECYSPRGEKLWAGRLSEASFGHFHGKDYLIGQTNRELQMIDPRDGAILWQKALKTEVVSIRQFAPDHPIAILTRNRSSLLDKSPEVIVTLAMLSSSGEQESVRAMKFTGDQAKAIRSYSSRLEILPGRKPAVILALEEKGMTTFTILEQNGSDLKVALEWTTSTSHSLQPWLALFDGSVLFAHRTIGSTRNEMLHLKKVAGEWTRTTLELPSEPKGTHPSPDEHKAVFLCEDHALLINLKTHEVMNGALEFSEGYERRVNFAHSVTWHPDGKTFFLWGTHQVHEFDGIEGKHLQTFMAHQRQREKDRGAEISTVKVDRAGKWLASGDTKGRVRCTPLTREKHTVEDLRKKCFLLGGYEIEEGDRLRLWSPPLVKTSSPAKDQIPTTAKPRK